MILPSITTRISQSCHAFIPPYTPVINKGKTWLSNLFQTINHSISISQIIHNHLSNLSDSRIFQSQPHPFNKPRPLRWIRISRPPLGLLHPRLLTLMMPLQPRAKTPKRRQRAVDQAPGLPATDSLFCGFSFPFSLPV